MTPICQKCHKPDPGKYYDFFYGEQVQVTEEKLNRRTTRYTQTIAKIIGESLFLCDSCVLKQMKKPYLILLIVSLFFGSIFAAGTIGSILSGQENAGASWVLLFFLGCSMLGAYFAFRGMKSKVPSDFSGEFLARSLRMDELKMKPNIVTWLKSGNTQNTEGIQILKRDTI